MSGPNYAPIQQTSAAQTGIATTSNAQAQQLFGQMQSYMQPAINYNQKIVGGDQSAALQAIAPQIANITQGAAQAKGQIAEQVGPGAARDIALAQNSMNTTGQIANLENTSYTSALDKLANIGSGLGSFSLNETGAALSGLTGASQSQSAVIQGQAQSKADTMSFLGSIVGAGGNVLGKVLSPASASPSDIRLKSAIEKVGEVGPLNLYSYDMAGKPEREVGFIAQEVAKVFPDAVVVGGEDAAKQPWKVNYTSVLAKMALAQAA